MSNDMAIIKDLIQSFGIDIIEHKNSDLVKYFRELSSELQKNSFCLDDQKQVIGLDLQALRFNIIPPKIIKLKNLQLFSFWGNRLENLPEDFYELTKLRFINLANNFLKTIPKGISKLKKLEILILEGNELEYFPEEVIQLKNLKVLNLNNNKISNIPENIDKFQGLHRLALSNNQLKALPTSIVNTTPEIYSKYNRRGGLELEGNPIEKPPFEIIEKGKKAIYEYFKSIALEKEKKILNEAKVILVGDGGSGKTSLVKQILGEKFNRNESQTHGINIRNWNAKKNGNDITVHFWDFGGQEIMYATHQFFLSKRSLYILVLDSRKDEKTEYWLKHIENFGGDSPILVVLNKIDQNPAFDANRKFLKEKYKGIKDFFKVSCATKHGIENFTDSLVDALSRIEILETTWAKSWFNVKSKLEKFQHPFISLKQYDDICNRENIIEESSKETLVEFLHDLGVIMHFSDIQLLDTHVLEPKWVTEAVYKIINSEKLAKDKGTLRTKQLGEILKKKNDKDYHYPPNKYGFIIDLMMKFELCYDIDKQTVLIPDLLEIQEPEYDFKFKGSLKYIIQYDFLPKSIIPSFMVRMHKDIAQNLRWRTGVVLKDDDCSCTALIKADEIEKKIFIYINGERKRDYLSIIRRTFRDINGSFEKLKVTELVPLPHKHTICSPLFCISCDELHEICIEYDELVGYESMGKKEYTVGKLRTSYNVSELLNGIEKEKDRKRKYEADEKGNVYHIQAKTVSIGKKEEKVSENIVNIGDGATFHGDFMVGSKIKDSFNKADSSNAQDDLKELLKTLSIEVGKIAEQMPKEEAEQVANDLQTFTNEATSEKPRRKWWELSAEGMKEAAKTVGEIGVSVIKNLDKITPLLENIL